MISSRRTRSPNRNFLVSYSSRSGIPLPSESEIFGFVPIRSSSESGNPSESESTGVSPELSGLVPKKFSNMSSTPSLSSMPS